MQCLNVNTWTFGALFHKGERKKILKENLDMKDLISYENTKIIEQEGERRT
jgi:hypothetical protein